MRSFFLRLILNIFLICTCLGIFGKNALGQLPVMAAPPKAPNMATLGVYGDVPVGNFTGLANFSLPLYQVAFKDLTVPISLTYVNSSGNKVDAMPGQVGLGWKLNAGGEIRRTSKELSGSDLYSALGGEQEVGQNPTALSDWYTETRLNDYLARNYNISSDSVKYDGFGYSFLGHSGNIYFDHLNRPRIKSTSGDNFKIEIKFVSNKAISFPVDVTNTSTAAPTTFSHKNLIYRFILTDNDGVKYTFGGTDESIEFVRPGLELGISTSSYNNFGVIASTWQLTSIEAPAGYKIQFNYQRGKIVVSKSVVSSDKVAYRGYSSRYNQSPAASFTEEAPLINGYRSVLTNPVYLSSIVTPQQHVEFSSSSADAQLPYPLSSTSGGPSGNSDLYYAYPDLVRAVDTDGPHFYNKLDNIKIYDTNELRYRTFTFNYNYGTGTRLKLNSIDILGGFTSTQSYNFGYNTLSLPAYLSSRTDHLGYFNNKTDSELSSHFGHNFDNYYLSREPDSVYSVAEILTKVTYPTKGYTSFDYEQNRYGAIIQPWDSVATPSSSLACGLRIKAISSYNHDNSLIEKKRYYYTKNYANGGTVSSGVLSYIPVYYRDFHTMDLTPPAMYASNNVNFRFEARVRVWSSSSLNPPTATQGNPVTYSEVVEKSMDNSFKVFTYKNYDNGYHDKKPLGYVSDHSYIREFWKDDPGSSMDLERGQVLREDIFDSNRAIKQQTLYTYNDDPNRFNDYIRVVRKRINDFYSPQAYIPSIRFTASQIFTYYPYLKKKETTSYFSSGNTTESTGYTYNSNKLIKTVLNTNSDGAEKSSKFYYPVDLVSEGQTIPYQSMIDSNLNSKVIREEQYVNGILRTTNKNLYSSWALNKTMYLPSEQKRKQDNQPEETVSAILKYDAMGNPFVIKEQGGAEKVVIWGYKGMFPVFFLDNTGYSSNSIPLDTYRSSSWLEMNPSDSQLKSEEVMIKLNYPQVYLTKTAYFPLVGVKLSKDVKGMNTYYEYDDFLRLKYVRDYNGTLLKQYCYNYKGDITDCNGPVFPGPSYINEPSLHEMMVSHFPSIQALSLNYHLTHPMDPNNPIETPLEFIYTTAQTLDEALDNGLPPARFYSDSNRQNLISDGYYTLGETDINYTGYKYYYFVGGLFQYSGWSY